MDTLNIRSDDLHGQLAILLFFADSLVNTDPARGYNDDSFGVCRHGCVVFTCALQKHRLLTHHVDVFEHERCNIVAKPLQKKFERNPARRIYVACKKNAELCKRLLLRPHVFVEENSVVCVSKDCVMSTWTLYTADAC